MMTQQVLYARIQTLATYAPEDQRERYHWAANSFRIPYWDWSLGDGGGGVPNFFVTETTMVATPEGRNIEMWNPLYKYTFKSIPDGFDDKVRSFMHQGKPEANAQLQFMRMNHTVRWPASESPWEDSRQTEFIESFTNLRRSVQDQVAVAFRRSDFKGFWDAIEQVHGWIHGTVGGGYSSGTGGRGHMWPLEYSSYEPLFWLHHT
jgi:tyrosinase